MKERRIVSCIKKGDPTWGPGVWTIPTAALKEIVLGARISNEMY